MKDRIENKNVTDRDKNICFIEINNTDELISLPAQPLKSVQQVYLRNLGPLFSPVGNIPSFPNASILFFERLDKNFMLMFIDSFRFPSVNNIYINDDPVILFRHRDTNLLTNAHLFITFTVLVQVFRS